MTDKQPWYLTIFGLAEIGHFFAGNLFILYGAVSGYAWFGLLLLEAWSIPKEFIWDKYKENQPFWSNAFDWVIYQFGALTALTVLYFQGRYL